MKTTLWLACALSLVGCRSNPYCLNCAPGEDMTPGAPADLSGPDLSQPGDMTVPPDLLMLEAGPCMPTNGGVETCDGVDNDCNGMVDDVPQDKLVGDPNNCGACNNKCVFPVLHQFGACVGGFDGGTPTCVPTTCQPGYVDRDLDPANGCEYICVPTANPDEAANGCDGKDNDCNGLIDEPFTTGYDAQGRPLYDKDVLNCGACGIVCNKPGAVAVCKSDPNTGKGVCGVDHCINDGTDTYRFKPDPMDPGKTRDEVGCNYHCPFPSTTVTTGSDDCDSVTCSFPEELCDGLDNDCDFTIDDPPFAASENIGGACGQNCPGGTPAGCKGECKAGTFACMSGVKQCLNSKGPSAEVCDGKDNDCNGLVDDPFTLPVAAGGYADGAAGQVPRYNKDPATCGSCATTCNHLQNATRGCRPNATTQAGECYVVACNDGYAYAPKAACGGPPGGAPKDGASGIGCYYQCPQNPPGPEVCDDKDNDCSGCNNDNLTPPPNFCANKGVCANQTIPVQCDGASGWRCDYRMVPNVEHDGTMPYPNLRLTELRCDSLDGNCNGVADKDGFPTLDNDCSAGLGVCRRDGKIACTSTTTAGCNVTADNTKRKDEECNNLDDDCDGLTDERTDDANGKGWRDPMVAVPKVGGGTVYVYAYEASRPDATNTSPGSTGTRACAKKGVIPWSNVTRTQAQAACAAIKDSTGAPMRLCNASEWETACEGGASKANTANSYSYSSAETTYVAGICNDENAAGTPALRVTGGGPQPPAQACFTPYGGTDRLWDMSGNVMEWTSSTVTAGGVTYYKIRGGAYTSPSDGTPPDGIACQFDFVIAESTFANSDVGFRCCSDAAP